MGLLDPGVRGMLDVARSVMTDLDVEAVLGRVLRAAQDITGARYAALGVLNEERTELARFITVGLDRDEEARVGPPPRGRGVLGELITHPTPLLLDDVGAHPRSYGFPAGHPPMQTFLGVPVVIRGEPYGNLYLTDKEGGEPFSEEDQEALTLLADFAAVAIDHARRFTGSEERRDELQRTVDALDATVQIARALGGQTDLNAILNLVAKRGRALVSARTLVIELVRGDQLVIAAAAGEVPAGVVGQAVPLADTVASAALRTKRVQHLDDQLNRSRFERHGLGRLGVEAASGLVVPLVFRGSAYGVLLALDRLVEGPAFTHDDERLLEAFAASAASGVATAESVAEEQRRQRLAAAEEERRRWARELHDETLQGLAALRLGLASARRAARPEAMDQVLAEAIGHLEEEIASLRSLITELRPAALDELGVEAAIQALADRSARQGLVVDVGLDLAYEQGREADRHAGELETAMYRIVQEALTNARKHGGASRAVVEITETSGTVLITVRDDGRGFDPREKTDGFGLMGMRERVELLGGTLQIESAPGEGTTVEVRLPVVRRAGEPEQLRAGHGP